MMSNALRSFKEAFEIQGELGRLVDAATSEMQLSVDWQANMQICDKVRVFACIINVALARVGVVAWCLASMSKCNRGRQ